MAAVTDTESREALLDAVVHGSTVAWRHLNLLGEYDFSAEKLRDSVGVANIFSHGPISKAEEL